MKKHKFLLPLAALAAALNTNQALANTQFIVNVDNATKANPDNIVINGTNQFDFILKTAEELCHLATSQLFTQNGFTVGICSMNLKHFFC